MVKKGQKQKKVKPQSEEETGWIMTATKEVLEHIASFSTICDEIKVHVIKTKGIHIKAVDPAHVAMRELTIRLTPALKVHTDFEFGIDLDMFKCLIPLMGRHEIEVWFRDFGNTVEFRYGRHVYEMKPADIMGMSDPKIPTMKLSGCYRADIREVLESLKHIEGLSNHIHIRGDTEGFNIIGLGDKDTYKGKFPGTCMDYDISLEGSEFHVLFSLDYFGNVVRTFKKLSDGDMYLQLRTDYPTILEINEEEGAVRYLDQFMVAPRIENE
jgi:hypothetical protein